MYVLAYYQNMFNRLVECFCIRKPSWSSSLRLVLFKLMFAIVYIFIINVANIVTFLLINSPRMCMQLDPCYPV